MDILGPAGPLTIDHEPVEDPNGTAIIVHGSGGYKDQPHVLAIAQACRDADLSTIRMNTRHALVGDYSRYVNTTVTGCIEDLRCVIEWTRTQPWFVEPLVLAGHSLGGICVLEEAHRHGAGLLVPVSPVVSGERLIRNYGSRAEPWRESGWKEKESTSKPGVVKRLKWNEYEADAKQYDTLAYAHELNVPTLLIVGSDDTTTTPEDERTLAHALPNATLRIIDGAPHTFRTPEHLDELKRIITAWLDEALAASSDHERVRYGPGS